MIGGGDMGRHVRDTDWSATPLGAYATWPQSLRSTLSLVLNAKGIAALYWGPEQWLLYNDAYGEALGERHPRAFGRPMPEVLTDIAPVLGPQVAEVLRTGEGFAIENLPLTMRRHGQDEETVWTYSFSPVQGETGSFAGVLLLATEMTRQKAIERSEEQARTRLETALKVAQLGTFHWHPSTGVIEVDARGREMFGLPAEGGLTQVDTFGCIAPEDVERVRIDAEVAMGIGRPFDSGNLGRIVDLNYDVIHGDGSRRSILSSGTVIRNPDGTRRMLGTLNDVTAFKQAEKQLRAQNATLEQRIEQGIKERQRIWQVSQDMLLVSDLAGVFVSVNPAWTRVLGWTETELVGRTSEWLEHPDDRARTRAEISRLASSGAPTLAFENRFRTRDGDYRDLSWTAVPDEGRFYCVARDVTGERARAEAQADAERVRLALSAGAIIGTWVWDLPTDRFTVDEAFATAFGLDPALGREGIPMARIVATVHPDDQAGLADAISGAVTRGGRYAHQYRVRRHDGRYYWLEANGHVEHGPDGTPLRFPGVLIDIEERRTVEAERERAIAALQDLHTDLERQVAERTLARNRIWHVSPDLLVVIDGTGRFETVNPAWTATLGWSEEELTQGVFFHLVHPDDLDGTAKVWVDANEHGRSITDFRNRYRHKAGGWRWLSWVGVPDDGKVYGSARDITAEVEQAAVLRESQAREERIRQNNQRMQTSLAAGAIIGTWNWNLGEDFFTFDEGFALAFGHDPSSAQTGLPIDRVLANVHPEDRPGLDAAINETIARGGSYARQYRVRRADGRYHWIEANGRVDFDAHGTASSFPGFVMSVEDRVSLEAQRDRATAELRVLSETLELRVVERTSKLMAAEEALRQSQKMEAVGQLTGGVAHDFNNLLTVIKSSTDLLKRPDLSEERRTRYIGAISDTVDRAAKLTGQLLAFARRQALRPEVFSVDDSVRGLADMMGTLTGSRIRITVTLPDTPCFVNADASQFDTALVNLAVNARDAMDGEGRITIRVQAVEALPAVRTHPEIDGPYVAVSISDTGSGIPPEMVERIFEPFFTTKETGKGTGLGLSQVFGFSKQSGGEVTVGSTVGEGTTFTLYLPRVAAPAPAEAVEAAAELVDGHGTRVLVVEDNVDVGTFAVQTLSDLGYAPTLATDGAAALAALAEGTDRFDVVFSDVMMPGMSGVELGQEIRRLYHDLPVVLTSGYSHILAQNGTYGFELLHKPYSVEQLSQILRKAAAKRRRKRITRQPFTWDT